MLIPGYMKSWKWDAVVEAAIAGGDVMMTGGVVLDVTATAAVRVAEGTATPTEMDMPTEAWAGGDRLPLHHPLSRRLEVAHVTTKYLTGPVVKVRESWTHPIITVCGHLRHSFLSTGLLSA